MGIGSVGPCWGGCNKYAICSPLLGLLGGTDARADGGGSVVCGEREDVIDDPESYMWLWFDVEDVGGYGFIFVAIAIINIGDAMRCDAAQWWKRLPARLSVCPHHV